GSLLPDEPTPCSDSGVNPIAGRGTAGCRCAHGRGGGTNSRATARGGLAREQAAATTKAAASCRTPKEATMYDITIDGQGYMVRAGSYERREEGVEEAASGRARLFDFYGGARRAAQLERDRFWRGVGAWPALDSQGLAAGPKRL